MPQQYIIITIISVIATVFSILILDVHRRSEDLLAELAPELVRGARLCNILRRFGREWCLSEH